MLRQIGWWEICSVVPGTWPLSNSLFADFRSTERNRMMLVSFKFNQFVEFERRDGLTVFEADLATIPADPDYVAVVSR